MDLPTAAQHIINGLSLGSLYALIAIGYTMVYGMLRLINFAHGDIVMMAAYFCVFGIASFHIRGTLPLSWSSPRRCFSASHREGRLPASPGRARSSILISAIAFRFYSKTSRPSCFRENPRPSRKSPCLWRALRWAPVNTQLISLLIPVVAVLFLTVLLYVINNTKSAWPAGGLQGL
jgi:branched-chain amino acid transport system permease protein